MIEIGRSAAYHYIAASHDDDPFNEDGWRATILQEHLSRDAAETAFAGYPGDTGALVIISSNKRMVPGDVVPLGTV